MTENPAGDSGKPDRPHHDPDVSPPAADRRKWPTRKKVLVLVLAVTGLGLIAGGFWRYPRRAEAPQPASVTLLIGGNSAFVNNNVRVGYTVHQLRPDLARVTVQLDLGPVAVPRGAGAGITLDGTARMLDCSPECTSEGTLTTGIADVFFDNRGSATADFELLGQVGEITDGTTAEVTFPDVVVDGDADSTLYISYAIPSANYYDWSAYPPTDIGPKEADWEVPIQKGEALPKELDATNRAAQQRDSDFTLIAGILIGIGGSALVAAVQEAFHD
jgi:hypothetical protein